MIVDSVFEPMNVEAKRHIPVRHKCGGEFFESEV